MSSEKWLVLGEVIAVLGGGLATAMLVLSFQPGVQVGLWSWPGILGLVLLAIGLAFIVVGLVSRSGDRDTKAQRQRSGAHSVNIQAGRDVKMDGK